MSTTHRITWSCTSIGLSGLSGSATEQGGTEVEVNQTVPAASTNFEIDLSIIAANLQNFFLVADQPCTIKTNSTSSPGNTWNLVANIPFQWDKSAGYFTNPVSADVTKFFVTCTPATNLKGFFLQT